MGTVDDPAVIPRVDIGLSTKLKAEVLDQIGSGAGERLGHAAEVHNNSFDAVSLAFYLSLESLHLVAIEGVGDIAADVDESHDCEIAEGKLNGSIEARFVLS